VAAGAALLLGGSLGLVLMRSPAGAAPPLSGWLGALLAAGVVLLGLYLLVRGRRALSLARRARRLRANHPGEPWLWEHPWNAFASFDESGAELRLPRFPCFTGGELDLKLVRTARIDAAGELRATLRCLQERREDGAGGRRTGRIVVHVLHEMATIGERTAGGEAIVFRFAVPAGLPGTTLAARPPRYWEVEVEGVTPGVDFGARFLLPVYSPR
jgi:hypothetical protein